jgi:hypothetical protein
MTKESLFCFKVNFINCKKNINWRFQHKGNIYNCKKKESFKGLGSIQNCLTISLLHRFISFCVFVTSYKGKVAKSKFDLIHGSKKILCLPNYFYFEFKKKTMLLT